MTQRSEGVLADFATQLFALANEMRDHPAAETAQIRLGKGLSLSALAQALLDHRHARKRYLPASLFHEPAWEILLSLFVAHEKGVALNVKHLVSLIDAPVTTSQRWIDQLVHMKLLRRVVDPNDRRRLEISLSEQGADAMRRYLASVAGTEAPAAS
jgi:DNA-binding MarR family transcriptional regulator